MRPWARRREDGVKGGYCRWWARDWTMVWPAECRVWAYWAVGLPREVIRRGLGGIGGGGSRWLSWGEVGRCGWETL